MGPKLSPVLFQADAQILILAYMVFMAAATSPFFKGFGQTVL